jgi:isopenicillin N synthase-like dioxygenase
MTESKRFFELPADDKQLVSKTLNSWNRGYEVIGSQILEQGTNPELKEGFYIGQDLDKSHPYFVNKKLNSGPNVWPETMPDVDQFKETTMAYYRQTVQLAGHLLQALALSLDLEEHFFDGFMEGVVATMRLLHYPPQPADCDEKLTRGIGAHTDFGAITLLLQDQVDGLQVWDQPTKTWIDVSFLVSNLQA